MENAGFSSTDCGTNGERGANVSELADHSRTTPEPRRVQLSRQKGWRMPPNTVKVDRTSLFGNPYRVRIDPLWNGGRTDPFGNPIVMEGPWLCEVPAGPEAKPGSCAGMWFKTEREALDRSIALFRLRAETLKIGGPLRERLPELQGKNLACWCKPGAPCHADVLLELANRQHNPKQGA